MIKKTETMLSSDFGSVKFYNDNCSLAIMIIDGRPLTGGKLTHNSSMIAPSGVVCLDDEGITVNLNFDTSAATFENWNDIKRVTDEMYSFYEEFMKEYGEWYIQDR